MPDWLDWFPSAESQPVINSYEWYIKLYYALRERAWAIGQYTFPRTNSVWGGFTPTGCEIYSGTVGSITATTLTAATQGINPWPAGRWYNYIDPNPDLHWIPQYYDVVIADTDEIVQSVVKTSIVGHTSNTLNFEDISDFVTSKCIPSLESLIGKKFYIIRQGGIWFNDRWPEWPNRHIYSALNSSSGFESLTDSAASWQSNVFVGMDLVFTDTANIFRRAVITGNTSNQIMIVGSGYTPKTSGGQYAVVPSGARWKPNQPESKPFQWYRGPMREWYTMRFDSDEVIRAKLVPENEITLPLGETCIPTGVTIFDSDVWTEVNDTCGTPDKSHAPDIWKGLRSLQVLTTTTIAPNFVERRDYSGRPYLHAMYPGEVYYAATGIEIEAETESITNLDIYGKGQLNLNTTVNFPHEASPAYPVTLYYTIYRVGKAIALLGDVLDFGSVTFTSGTSVSHLGGGHEPLIHDDVPGVVTPGVFLPRPVRISFGWERSIARRVRYIYPKTIFIPSSDDFGNPIDPPNDVLNETGSWTTRNSSSNYLDFDEHGRPKTFGEQLVVGDLARYWGDNYSDPIFTQPGTAPISTFDYTKNFVTRHGNPEVGGTATSGTTLSITDSSKVWESEPANRTETGTASSGSSGSMSDSSKGSSSFWSGEGNRWVGFILRGPGGKAPITGHSGTTISYPSIFGVIASAGQAYSIREPVAEINKLQNRKVIITDPATGIKYTRSILYNDEDTLYLDSALPFAVVAGTLYQVIEWIPGAVLRWNGSSWESPDGDETMKALVRHEPTRITRTGFLTKWDDVVPFLRQMHRLVNNLVWTIADATWSSRLDPVIPETNYTLGHSLSLSGFDSAELAIVKAQAEEGFPTRPEPEWTEWHEEGEENNQPPYALAITNKTGDGCSATLARRVGYPTVENIPCILACLAEVWCYTTIDEEDSDSENTGQFLKEFNPHGDPFTFRAWGKILEVGPSNSKIRKGPISGVLNELPFWGTDAPDPLIDPEYSPGSSTSQYYVKKTKGILKWDVVGGFQYK